VRCFHFSSIGITGRVSSSTGMGVGIGIGIGIDTGFDAKANI